MVDEARQRLRAPDHGIFSRSGVVAPVEGSNLPTLTTDHAAPLARRLFQEAMLAIDAEPLAPAGWDRDQGHLLRMELEDRHRRLTGSEPSDGRDDVADTHAAVLRDAGLCADPDSKASALLRNYLRRAMAQVAAIRIARLDGDFSDQVSDRLFGSAPVAATVSTSKPRHSRLTLGAAIERYRADVLDLRPLTEKTSEKHRALLSHAQSFFGAETLIGDIERVHCTRYRDTLAKLPPNFTKHNATKGLSLEQMAAANRDGPTLAWATQNVYLKMVDDLMGWAVKERIISDNVAADISPLKKREAAETRRLSFGAHELANIFAQPIFTGCLDDERNYAKPGPNLIRRSRYWVPILALFTGMRMGEILQLTPGHIRVSPSGTAFFVLTRDMRLKTENAEREIPIHPMLNRLGFLKWVEKQRDAERAELFDDVPASKHGYRSDMFTKRFATFLKRVDLPAHRRSKLCFHSFRHTFKDALNETGAPESEMDEICGWSRGKKTGRRYGTGLRADRLKPFIEQIEFDVDFERLIVASAA